MVYLLDANVLIDANRDYYPIARVPEFWDWLAHHASVGNIQMPRETYDEVTNGHKDELRDWVKDEAVKGVLLLSEEPDPVAVAHVINEGYGRGLTDEDIVKLGNDPFLISYALGERNRCVVTTEGRKPSLQRANRKIPDVCNTLNISCSNTFELTRALNFSTSWRP